MFSIENKMFDIYFKIKLIKSLFHVFMYKCVLVCLKSLCFWTKYSHLGPTVWDSHICENDTRVDIEFQVSIILYWYDIIKIIYRLKFRLSYLPSCNFRKLIALVFAALDLQVGSVGPGPESQLWNFHIGIPLACLIKKFYEENNESWNYIYIHRHN